MIKGIALLNKSTVMTNIDITKIASANSLQISRDVAPAWGRSSIPVNFYSSENLVPSGYTKVYFFDNTDQPGALGYHDELMSGVVYAKVFVKTITSYGLPLIYDFRRPSSITVASVASHEIIEMFINPYVSLWADGPVLNHCSSYAYEACDAVESNVYLINVGSPSYTVAVSNFVYPEYFDSATPVRTKIDQMGLLTNPFTMTSGGYMILRNTSGGIVEVFGSKYPDVLKELNKL